MGSLVKAKIGKEDIEIQYNTNAAETVSRTSSTGGTTTITKFPDIWGGTGKISVADMEVTNGMTTQGDIEYHDGTSRTRLAAGTAYKFLRTAGASANPSWQYPLEIVDVRSYASLSAAVTAVGTTKTILIPNEQTLTANLSSEMHLSFVEGGKITLGAYNLTLAAGSSLEATFNQQIFNYSSTGVVVFAAGVVPEVYPQWFGTAVNATTIDYALDSLTSGGLVRVTAGTHTVAAATIIMVNDNTTLQLDDKCVLNSTGGDTDYTIKITGANCRVIGPGAIQCPDNPSTAAAGIAALRKAIIWNTGDNTTIEGVTFTNIPTYGIHNEDGNYVKVRKCRFLGGYDGWLLDTTATYNHFAMYSNSGYYCEFVDNYVEYCVQGVGSGAIVGSGGAHYRVCNNEFVNIGNHPVYLMSANYSVIDGNKTNNCGSPFAADGTHFTITNNIIHMDCTLYYGGDNPAYQSGISIRNAYYCVIANNILSGHAEQVVLGLENIDAGVQIVGNVVANNIIYMGESGSDTYAAIRVGSAGTTTLNQDNKVIGNKIYIGTGTHANTVISFYATAADQVLECEVSNNTIQCITGTKNIYAQYGENLIITNNTIVNRTTYDGSTTIYGVYLDQCHDCDIHGNNVISTTSANIAHYPYFENGTNAQVYNNRWFHNRVNSAATGGSLISMTVIAGNNSEVLELRTSETYAVNTVATFSLADGHTFFLTATGGARNFNPSGTFPKNYRVDLYHVGATNNITFDSTGLNVAVAPGKHGIFHYSGTAWKGSQVD